MSLDQRRKEGGNDPKPPGLAAGASGAPAAQGGRPPPQPAHKQPAKDKDDKPKEEVKVTIHWNCENILNSIPTLFEVPAAVSQL